MQRQANSRKHSKKVHKITTPNKTFANPGFTTNFKANKAPRNKKIPPIKNILKKLNYLIHYDKTEYRPIKIPYIFHQIGIPNLAYKS